MSSVMGKKLVAALVIILLGVGLVAGLMAVQQSTETRQHASSIFSDLNTAGEIDKTNNADGTMGPATWQGNFSNTLPEAYLGLLNFGVTDPEQGKMPTKMLPTQAQGKDQKASVTAEETMTPGQGGPQAVTSLVLTIKKVEVHLARLGIPGAKNTIEPTEVEGKPTLTPKPRDNQDVDKWETLNIAGLKTIDLVILAKNHDITSLGITKLVNGRYTEVRLYIGTASAVLANGTKVDLTIPGRANIVRIVEPFVINAGKTTMVHVDFDAQNSVIRAGDAYLLKPVVARFDQKNQE